MSKVDIEASPGEMKGMERGAINTLKVAAYGTKHSFSELKPMTMERRVPQHDDVVVQVMFCGICCTDVHYAKNEGGHTIYPCVPGHEVVGTVTQLGTQAKKFRVGEVVAIGPIVDSCGICEACHAGVDQYCERGFTMAYNGNIRHGNDDKDGVTRGGYSQIMVVNERHVLRVPAGYNPAAAAPLVCAGVSVYSALLHWNVSMGSKIAVVGYGGLGHLAVKLAVARGATVTVLSKQIDIKTADALRNGAVRVVDECDKSALESIKDSFDLVLSTIPVPHDPARYVQLLRRDGTLVIVGAIGKMKGKLDVSALAFDRRSIASSVCGSTAETQALLDFCAAHKIVPDIKIIPVEEINDAYRALHNGEAAMRYVIDMSTLKI